MDAFAQISPDWTARAIHASEFCCPSCRSLPDKAQQVWINRRAPVYTETHQRKWQEFYDCECGTVWWAWSSDRPPTTLKKPDQPGSIEPFPGDWMF